MCWSQMKALPKQCTNLQIINSDMPSALVIPFPIILQTVDRDTLKSNKKKDWVISHTKHDFWLVAVENIFYTPSMLTIFGNQAE